MEPLRLLNHKPRSKHREPHRMKPSGSTWTYPVPRECLGDHLRCAKHPLDRCGEPYSFEAAVVDLYLDTDRGGELRPESGTGGYDKRWGWGRQQVRDRWEGLMSALIDWRTSYGRI